MNSSKRTWILIGGLLLLAGLVVLPFLVKNFRVFQLNMVMVYAIAILGLNILTGYNGQISLGHGAFYAIGAYVAAMLMAYGGWPFWLTLPVAALVCFVFGYLMGFPALRLGGHYLALATFALALAIPQLLKYKAIEGWTGGVMGIVLTKPEPGLLADLTMDLAQFNDTTLVALEMTMFPLLEMAAGLACSVSAQHAICNIVFQYTMCPRCRRLLAAPLAPQAFAAVLRAAQAKV